MRLGVAGDSFEQALEDLILSPKGPKGASESQAVSGGFFHCVTMRLKSIGVSARWTHPAFLAS